MTPAAGRCRVEWKRGPGCIRSKRAKPHAGACRTAGRHVRRGARAQGILRQKRHLYHAHPPTGWIRFEGKLRPHCFDLNKLEPSDLHDPEGQPSAFLGNDDVQLSVSRRAQPMPFYYRNADGDELYLRASRRGRDRDRFRSAAVRARRLPRHPARGHLPRRARDCATTSS